MIISFCIECGIEICDYKKRRYCSRKCMLSSQSYKDTMSKSKSGCKKSKKAYVFPSGENHWNWKGGIKSTRKKDYYIDYRNNNKDKRKIYNNKRRAIERNLESKLSLEDWNNLKIKYNYTCPCCGISEPEIKLTIDHILPISLGGNNNIENIQPLCFSCNSKKHTKIIKYNIDN